MSYKYIKDRVAAEGGFTDYQDNPDQSKQLDFIINQAAKEVWESVDLPGSLREMYVSVVSDTIVPLPPFVSSLRAIRDPQSDEPWSLKDMRPRYHYTAWENKWNTWRFIGTSPIKQEIINMAPFTYEIPVADSELIVTAVGTTVNASRESDSLVMSAVSKVGTKSFLEYQAIRLNKVADYNITIKDADDREMAVLYSSMQESRYTLYDISMYPSQGSCPDGTKLMEVLYKMQLPVFVDDHDTFPVDGFNDIIAMKALQLLIERQEGKEKRAMLLDAKIKRITGEKIEHIEGTQEKDVFFAPNPLFGLFSTGNNMVGRRMSSRYGGNTFRGRS